MVVHAKVSRPAAGERDTNSQKAFGVLFRVPHRIVTPRRNCLEKCCFSCSPALFVCVLLFFQIGVKLSFLPTTLKPTTYPGRQVRRLKGGECDLQGSRFWFVFCLFFLHFLAFFLLAFLFISLLFLLLAFLFIFFCKRFFAFGQVKGNARHGRSRHRPTNQSFRVCKVNPATPMVATLHFGQGVFQ